MARASVALDQQSVGRISRIDAMQQQAVAQAQERQRAVELALTKQALVRIQTKDFGYCLHCDEQRGVPNITSHYDGIGDWSAANLACYLLAIPALKN